MTDQLYEEEKRNDTSGDSPKYSYITGAAKPSAATKKWYFDDYQNNNARPEDWVEQSLPEFNYWNQSDLTLPYLKPALESLEDIKQRRKIFFVLAWLNEFISGQQSEAADAEVHAWLNSTRMDEDLRLKVLQTVDELDRTVRIKRLFP
jgi:aminopeptidase N